MNVQSTLLIYGLIGVVVGVSHALRSRTAWATMVATALGATLFWPVFLPFLFGRTPHASAVPHSRFDARIVNGERRLTTALDGLDGVAEHLLAPQRARLRTLGDGLRAMAARTAEMERLLATPEFERATAESVLSESPDDSALVTSLRARLRNIDRLERMYLETSNELERALLRVEEIGSQMVLLKFVDDPDREALRLLDELALTVEGATEGLAAAV